MLKNLVNFSELSILPEPPEGYWTPLGNHCDHHAMPETHKEQIFVLDQASTTASFEAFNRRDLLCGIDGWGGSPFSGGCYKRVESFHMLRENDVKKWLYHRSIPFDSEAIVLPVFKAESDPAVFTTWKMIIKYSDELFSMDDMVVANNQAQWCLYFHHDGLLTVAQEPVYEKWCWEG